VNDDFETVRLWLEDNASGAAEAALDRIEAEVERLRDALTSANDDYADSKAEVERLRAALEQIADATKYPSADEDYLIARVALAKGDVEDA
jgi:plasmid stabilization system protein ParE